MSDEKAQKIIDACEEYHSAWEKFPNPDLKTICLDGDFSVEQLLAFVHFGSKETDV